MAILLSLSPECWNYQAQLSLWVYACVSACACVRVDACVCVFESMYGVQRAASGVIPQSPSTSLSETGHLTNLGFTNQARFPGQQLPASALSAPSIGTAGDCHSASFLYGS